jgi:pSer/pThr/pTyr-binding forkhead associated (FHA) protein
MQVEESTSTDDNDVVGFLYHMEGPASGEIAKLLEGRNTLGTSLECSLQLSDPSVSAKHASLRYENDEYVLRDLDSKNGTYVNGEEVVTHKLTENDVIVVGDTKLKFKML